MASWKHFTFKHKIYNASCIPDAAHMSSTYYASCSRNPINIKWRVQMMKLHVRQFSVLYCYLLLLALPRSNVFCVVQIMTAITEFHTWKNICTLHVCEVVKYSESHFTVTEALSLLLRTPLIPKPTVRSYRKPDWQYLQLFLLLYCISAYIVVKIIRIAWKLNQPCGKECNKDISREHSSLHKMMWKWLTVPWSWSHIFCHQKLVRTLLFLWYGNLWTVSGLSRSLVCTATWFTCTQIT